MILLTELLKQLVETYYIFVIAAVIMVILIAND